MFLLSLVWFLKTTKYILFWMYLWQLKEYHAGRFVDHFRTKKGKDLLVNYLLIVQVVIFFLFLYAFEFTATISFALLCIYLFQLAVFIRQISLGQVKRPVPTVKSLFLTALVFAGVIWYGFWTVSKNPAWLIALDIMLPVATSIIVLLFQPFSVLMRNRYLAKAREKMKQFPNVKVIIITGSYGKTSTKEFLTTILSKKYTVLATKDHQNSEIAIAKCILHKLTTDHEIFIAEVGAYNKGKIKEVCSVVKPDMGIVTGINEQHLSLFGSLENLLSAEGGRELDASLKKGGVLFINGDNKYCVDLYKRSRNEKRVYALHRGRVSADLWAEDISVDKHSVLFVVKNNHNHITHVRLNVLGKQNVQNALGAMLVATELGMSLEEIAEASKHITKDQAGMIAWETKQGITVIDSSYSSNPDGVIADIEYLSMYEKKKIIIMPCLIELGVKSKEVHEMIGKKIAKVCDMAIITSKDNFAELQRGAVQAGMSEKSIIFCEKSADIHALVTLFCSKGDAVLLEGRVPKDVVELFSV